MATPQRTNKVLKLQTEVDLVRSTMGSNLQKLMERGECLESLETRADDLQASTNEFRTCAVKIKRQSCFSTCKSTMIIGCIVAMLGMCVVSFVMHQTGLSTLLFHTQGIEQEHVRPPPQPQIKTTQLPSSIL